MNQYFVKYSLNGKSKLLQFTCHVDAEPKKTAQASSDEILLAVCKIHNASFKNKIYTDDVVIEVLTRLN